MKRLLPKVVVATVAAVALLPAQSRQSMQANIRGGGGDTGKCTIEVEVDGAAEVEVRGAMGHIRTLQGQRSNWRRFECTSPLPSNPVDFRFKGIDGRGDVRLIRDPYNSRGTAVVRILDNKGGREGYTFDLLWRQGAYGNDPYYDRNRRNDSYRNDPYRRNDPYYGDDRYRSNNGWGSSNGRIVGMCQDAVRSQAARNYGVRNPNFNSTDVDNGRGSRDRVEGTFYGNRGDRYSYSCSIDSANGRIRDIDIRRR